MTERPKSNALSRRQLLGLAGVATAATASAQDAGLPVRERVFWDELTDVLVVGSGAAGACAAIEARTTGARVLLIESLPHFGGTSAISHGVIYAGGGTALQRALGVNDSIEAMFTFLSQAAAGHPEEEKLRLYCERSPEHFDWLVAQGMPYRERFSSGQAPPSGEESLYFSGNELAWPARDLAQPAPRGHAPAFAGGNGGRRLMQILLARIQSLGVETRAGVSARSLVVESDGRVSGLRVDVSGRARHIRARRGVILAAGGFVHNRTMLQWHAPELYDCSAPWGSAGDLGEGISMAQAAGAAALRMHQGCTLSPLGPPERVLSGIVINQSGQRFVAEDSFQGVVGHAIAYNHGGQAWLITDRGSEYNDLQDKFLPVARGNTIGDIAAQLSLPRGALQNTVAFYNRQAANGNDPLLGKSTRHLRPLQGPPYTAWDLSVKRGFFPTYTLGGLHTRVNGAVRDSFGEVIPGLYAAGRATAGLAFAPYVAEGLSLGDCTFFGRQAGLAAAQGWGVQ